MSDILANVSVVLGAEISAFRAGMAQARRELRGVVQAGEAMKDVGRSLSTYVTAPLLALGAGAVAASGKIESLRNALTAISSQDLARQGTTGVAALGEAATLTKDRMKELEVLARQPGLGFEQAVQGDVRLRAVGISAEQSAKSLKAFANAIATTGGGKSEFDRVTVQLAQLSAKGKVLAQDLRPIIEAAPAVSAALQKLYGTVDSEEISKQLQKQGQSSTDFIAVLTDELGKIPTVAGGLKNSLENLGDTVTISLAKIGDGISRALNLPAVLAGISDFVTRIGEAFNGLSPATQKMVIALAGVAAATGPILFAVGSLGVALPAITAGFATLSISSVAALGPIGLAAGAVAGAALLIYDNWSSVSAYFSGEGGRAFRDFGSAVVDAAGEIIDAFATIGRAYLEFSSLFVSKGAGPLGRFASFLVDSLSSALGVVSNGIRLTAALLRGDLTAAAAIAEAGGRALVKPYVELFGLGSRLASSAAEFREFFKGITPPPEVVEGLNSVGIAGALETGLLEGLKEKLKAVREQREKENNERAIFADNKVITTLEKEIARLEGTDKAGKKAADTLEKLRLALLAVGTRVGLGVESVFDGLNEKIKLLKDGIEALTKEGMTGKNPALQGLVVQLAAVQGELKKTLDSAKFTAPTVAVTFDPYTDDIARIQKELNESNLTAKVAFEYDHDKVKLAKALADNQQAAVEALAKAKVPSTRLDAQSIAFDVKPLRSKALETDSLKRYADGLKEIAAFSTALGASFDVAGAKIQAAGQRLQDLIQNGGSAADIADVSQSIEQLQKFKENAELLKGFLLDAFSGIGQAIGASLMEGTNVVQAAGAALLKALADLAAKKGALMIADGALELLIPGLQAHGAGLIAAGGALVVAAGVAGAYASSAGRGGGSSGVNASTNYGSRASNVGQASPQRIQVEVVGTLKASGADLAASLRTRDYRNLRTS